ncbi:MAG: acylphosphatase [Anaerosomatales bacterium]|nr:acylphosphatase [Anaerosomatales bacterium]
MQTVYAVAIVSGDVQGRGFRAACQNVLRTFGVKGYAINRPDGTVTVRCFGDPIGVQSVLDALPTANESVNHVLSTVILSDQMLIQQPPRTINSN